MESNKDRFKPSATKHMLFLLAGTIWVAAGSMLCFMAYRWLKECEGNNTILFAGTGLSFSLIIHHFGFLRVVDKNLGRIMQMEEKPCLFSFISLKSYLIVLVMVSAGIALRHSQIPKEYLSVLYLGIGAALILSSIRYLRHLVAGYK
jgi:hypothetical protein